MAIYNRYTSGILNFVIRAEFQRLLNGHYRGKIAIFGIPFTCWLVEDHPLTSKNFRKLSFTNPHRKT